MTTPATPRVVEIAIAKLAPGWRHTITHGVGTVTKLPVDPDTRKQVETILDVQSVALRLRHTDGRAAVAVWGGPWVPDEWAERRATKKLGARSVLTPAHWQYGFVQAFAWQVCVDAACPRAGTDHPAEPPRQINATTFAEYIAADLAPVLTLFPDTDLTPERTAA